MVKRSSIKYFIAVKIWIQNKNKTLKNYFQKQDLKFFPRSTHFQIVIKDKKPLAQLPILFNY